ncbi:MAG: 50S ribosomal protein L19 [Anaerolineales bacterium]|nr:MAG: 50S ribosomal protein L19 [Anaerolineales bacterium]
MANATDLIRSVENLKEEVPNLAPGDTVKVHVRIVEGNRERVQIVQGVVISIRGSGINKSFTVRRTASHGVGVERTFLLHSPRVERVEVIRNAHVRRAKLYYLRERSGKSARLRERRDQ